MLRVAMIANYPRDPRIVPGGVAAVAHTLTRGLGRIDAIDLHVISFHAGLGRDVTERRDGATIHFLDDPNLLSYATSWFWQRRKLARLFDRLQPDLVHGQGLGLPAAAALHLGRPHAVTLHGVTWREQGFDSPSPRQRWRGRFHAWVAYRQVRRLRNVFIISEYAARMLPTDRHYQRYVINNPVADELFSIRNEPCGPHVLWVGGTRQRKDPLTALAVMEKVLARVPEATLHMVGPPSGTALDQTVARAVAGRRLQERVKILDLVPAEVLWREYAGASLLLMTSLEETAPVAIGEAFAAGIPVVATGVGGIPFMVRNGDDGFVLPVGDAAGLAEAVIGILTDAPLRTRLGAAAKRTGRREFSLDAIAGKTVAAYEEILGS
jgi:glycosyltransferase involved in cell wall biosynthesis